MSLTNASAAGILRPEDIQALIVEPLIQEAVCTQISTVVHTGSSQTRFPRVKADPVASWTSEGEEITPTDADIDELTVTPKKLAGLTIVSSELANDSDPAALQIIGQGLIRDLQTRLDAAYFGETVENGPDGLGSLSTGSVNAQSLDDLDWAIGAISAAEQVGSKLTAFVAHPAVVEEILKARVATDYNQTLLAADPSSPTKRSVYGVPLHSSPHVDQTKIWGIDSSKAYVVIRTGATLATDTSAFFTSDRVAVRCTLRVGFAWPHEAALVAVELPGT